MEVDHIGFVVDSLEGAVARFIEDYGFELKIGAIYDPVQHVRLAMLSSSNCYNLELIEPVDDKSPSYDFMKKGGGLHHLCYAVEDIENSVNELKKRGHILIKRPACAPLLSDRKVAFLFSKIDHQVIELAEKENG